MSLKFPNIKKYQIRQIEFKNSIFAKNGDTFHGKLIFFLKNINFKQEKKMITHKVSGYLQMYPNVSKLEFF